MWYSGKDKARRVWRSQSTSTFFLFFYLHTLNCVNISHPASNFQHQMPTLQLLVHHAALCSLSLPSGYLKHLDRLTPAFYIFLFLFSNLLQNMYYFPLLPPLSAWFLRLYFYVWDFFFKCVRTLYYLYQWPFFNYYLISININESRFLIASNIFNEMNWQLRVWRLDWPWLFCNLERCTQWWWPCRTVLIRLGNHLYVPESNLSWVNNIDVC